MKQFILYDDYLASFTLGETKFEEAKTYTKCRSSIFGLTQRHIGQIGPPVNLDHVKRSPVRYVIWKRTADSRPSRLSENVYIYTYGECTNLNDNNIWHCNIEIVRPLGINKCILIYLLNKELEIRRV